ncbi:hypothetical protein TELCIR_14798 [Teladorsagia circumcincta]|uniref:Uncharacterized protein n=1 Tax=Teladorsagia circumcincta TaxID=45464 RepID=A0A2G9U098_TELCI|nr:hypothetical protein TELCIR_14798 [Teladorsagia circumcincta]
METDTVYPSSSLDDSSPAARMVKTVDTSSVKNEPPEMDAKVEQDSTEQNDQEEVEDDNPIKKAARQTMKDVKVEAPDFYDPEEDEQNEKWMQQHRRRTTGINSASKTEKEAR